MFNQYCGYQSSHWLAQELRVGFIVLRRIFIISTSRTKSRSKPGSAANMVRTKPSVTVVYLCNSSFPVKTWPIVTVNYLHSGSFSVKTWYIVTVHYLYDSSFPVKTWPIVTIDISIHWQLPCTMLWLFSSNSLFILTSCFGMSVDLFFFFFFFLNFLCRQRRCQFGFSWFALLSCLYISVPTLLQFPRQWNTCTTSAGFTILGGEMIPVFTI